MIELAPKKRFQENDDARLAFRRTVTSSEFQNALGVAISDFAIRAHPTTDELNGARNFIAILLNLSEVEQPPTKFPSKSVPIIEDTRKPLNPKSPTH